MKLKNTVTERNRVRKTIPIDRRPKSATAAASRRAASQFAHTNFKEKEIEEISKALVLAQSNQIQLRNLTDEENLILIDFARLHGVDESRLLQVPTIANRVIQKISSGFLDLPQFAKTLKDKLEQKQAFSEEEFFVMLVIYILSTMQKQLPSSIRQLPSGVRGLPPRQQESKSGFDNKILENYNYFYNSWKTFLKG